MQDIKDFMEELTESKASEEIDLAPMLALMVTLIPVLLLSAVFVKITMIETTLPVLTSSKITKKSKEKDFDLNVYLNEKNEIDVQVLVDDRIAYKKLRIPASVEKGFDVEKLNQELVKIKKKFPDQFRVQIHPADKVGYDKIVKIMDATKKSSNEGDLFVFQGKNNEKVETKFMFPDVVFGNVVE